MAAASAFVINAAARPRFQPCATCPAACRSEVVRNERQVVALSPAKRRWRGRACVSLLPALPAPAQGPRTAGAEENSRAQAGTARGAHQKAKLLNSEGSGSFPFCSSPPFPPAPAPAPTPPRLGDPGDPGNGGELPLSPPAVGDPPPSMGMSGSGSSSYPTRITSSSSPAAPPLREAATQFGGERGRNGGRSGHERHEGEARRALREPAGGWRGG